MSEKTKKNTNRKAFISLKALGVSKEVIRKFEKEQALRILRLPNSKWEIADDKYTFSANEIRKKPNSGTNKESKEQNQDSSD